MSDALLVRAASSATGRVLRGAVLVIGRRPAEKPMHPRGEVRLARLERTGGPEPTGAAFLDEVGVDEDVLVRYSRGAGLPEPWPDLNGLAVRVPGADGGYADVLLSSAGRSRLGRYLPAPTRVAWSGFFSTLLPYRSPTGAVHVGAVATSLSPGAERFDLLWARPGGRSWHCFGVLALDPDPGLDMSVSFDAFGDAPAGLAQYDWHRRLREPAYATARHLRGR